MRPPLPSPPAQEGSSELPFPRWLRGALLGAYHNHKGERVMTVKARINGREFSLSWEEFEKALLRNDLSGGQIEVISIFTGMRPCYSLQVG